MKALFRRPAFWLVNIAVCAALAVIAGAITVHPWTLQAAGQEPSPSSHHSAKGPNGLVASAEFPSSTGVQADVQMTTATPEMLAAAPSSFTSLGTASFSVDGGKEFPAAGATITIDLPAPAAAGHGILIAHWNQQDQVWEPVKTDLSVDRTKATATVPHFSEYGFWDYMFNVVNQLTGNGATSGVQCDSPMPAWADPQYFDDINGPILWCGGKDRNNADILVAKMKMNRGSAAVVSTAIKPAWVWSDLWDDMGPETMLQMLSTAGMTSPATLADGYVVQPLGEYDFGFSRSALEAFYADGRWDKPLVQVSLGWQYTAFGVLYDQIKDTSQGNVAGAVAMLALGQCSYDISKAPNSDSAAAAFSGVMGCIGSSFDAVQKGAITFVSKKKGLEAASAGKLVGPALSRLKFLTSAYTIVSSAQKIFTTAGDLSLPDITRQFLYQPSVSAIKETAAKKKAAAPDQTYSGSAVDLSFSFSHPAGWSVAGSNEELSINNAAGTRMAALSVILVWGAEGPFMSADVAAEANYGNFVIKKPKTAMCGSCTTHVRSLIVDSRTATSSAQAGGDPVKALGWPLPVVVSTTISGDQLQVEKVDPRYLDGVQVFDSGVTGANGDTKRVAIFGSRKYFSTVAEAKAWLASPEHIQVEKMLASFRVN